MFLAKIIEKKRSKKIFLINSVLKTNPCTYKTKDLNGKKIGSFYEKKIVVELFSRTRH